MGRTRSYPLDGVSAVYTVDDDIDFDLDLYEFNTLMGGNPVPLTYATSSIQTSIPGRSSRKYVSSSGEKFAILATSRMFGHGCDNPQNQNQLTNITCPDASAATVDQAKRCFMVEFSNVSEFFVSFRILTDKPRNYISKKETCMTIYTFGAPRGFLWSALGLAGAPSKKPTRTPEISCLSCCFFF
ncbi:unnamed protein product [Prorocentrum cordatum]|uniref:Uncharacterized protein n=1 Tax=Prorocentrum cordatum TaxID=2364126 RepID=A0ABN9UYL3_9DINO|nr:unnamed protein product [Polarella glacialis]